MDKVLCEPNHDICTNTSCNVKLIDRRTRLANIVFFMRVPQNDIHIRYTLFYRFREYRKFLLDADADICDYMAENRTISQPLLDVLIPIFLKNVPTYYNHSCPFEGNISLLNFTISSDLLKGNLIPAGQYRIDCKIFNSVTNKLIILVRVYWTISAGSTTKDLAMG